MLRLSYPIFQRLMQVYIIACLYRANTDIKKLLENAREMQATHPEELPKFFDLSYEKLQSMKKLLADKSVVLPAYEISKGQKVPKM